MAGFRKASPEQAALKFAIYGPPGSGKTFTTLLVAEGLANIIGKRVAMVDTERGRRLPPGPPGGIRVRRAVLPVPDRSARGGCPRILAQP